NPQDVLELEFAFQRIGSPYHVISIHNRLKIIRAGIERTESLLNRHALTVRRGIGDGQAWHLGRNAGGEGKPMLGSRFLWEINNWQYPHTERGDAQTDNPNDDSADGADMMAMLRYLVMAYWEEKKPQEETAKRNPDAHPGWDEKTHMLRDDRRYTEREPEYRIPEYRVPWPDN
ncbi:MAG: hypothetical protein ABIU86_11095, partial [Gemmatimonadaceae bacterium]